MFFGPHALMRQMPVAAMGGATPFTLAYVTKASDGTSQTTFTFNSVSLGAAAAADETRYIIVGICASTSTGRPPPTNIAVDDDAAAVRIDTTGTATAPSAIYRASPTGSNTTGTITITFAGAVSGGLEIFVWRMGNPSSSTAVAHTNALHSSGVVTLSINVSSGGKGVAVATSRSGSTWTWVGASEEADDAPSGSLNASGATISTSGSPTTITATNANSSPANASGCSASWL
jgi:hypothetical protein